MSVFDEAVGEITWNHCVREVVREKYAMERDKRLRPEGPDQYITVDVDGESSDYLDDPYCDAPFQREPVFEDAQVVVIGGFSGLLAGARLRQARIADVRRIDRARVPLPNVEAQLAEHCGIRSEENDVLRRITGFSKPFRQPGSQRCTPAWMTT